MCDRGKNFGALCCVVAFTSALILADQTSASIGAFEGKQLRLVIGSAPGGGWDLEARVLARHLPKHIPGAPSVIVQNMPGAGGVIAATYVYTRAKPDGLTLTNMTRLQLMMALMEEVKFDATRMATLWGVSGSNVDLVRDVVKARSAEDLRQVDATSLIVGGRTRADPSCVAGQLSLQLLAIKGFRAVCAYNTTAAVKAAMERGEVTFFVGTDAFIMAGGAFAEMAEKGSVMPIWQSGAVAPEGNIVRSPTVRPDLPTFYESYQRLYGRPPSGVMWDAYKVLTVDLGMLLRTYVAPPGTPTDRILILRRAMTSLTNDSAFVADWERVFGQELSPAVVPVETIDRLKTEIMRPAPWQDFLRKLVKE